MREKLVELFDITPKRKKLNDIVKDINPTMTKTEFYNLMTDLRHLELDGKVYYDEINNSYYAFPSNFIIGKVVKKQDNVITFVSNKEIFQITVNQIVNKSDYLVLEVVGNSFCLKKVLGKNNGIAYYYDQEKLINLFNGYDKTFTLKSLKKILKCNEKELVKELSLMEDEGKIYFDENDNYYKAMPNNYFIADCVVTKHGDFLVKQNNIIKKIKKEEAFGLLPFDKVIFANLDGTIKPIKILARNYNAVCTLNPNKELQVIGNNELKIKCIDKEFLLQKWQGTERFLMEITKAKYKNTYYAHLKEVLPAKNFGEASLENILYNNGFNPRYTPEELQQVENLPTFVSKEEKETRLDLTNEKFFSIDSANTKDIDDAISIKKLNEHEYQVIIAIADVAHYIKYGSPLWNRALQQSTNVYLIDQVLEMLHPNISNGICSLNPGQERLAKAFIFKINDSGKIIESCIEDAVIKSQMQMDYVELENMDNNEKYANFKEELKWLEELSNIVTKKKRNDGAAVIEYKNKAQNMVQIMMILANELMGEYMFNLGINSLYLNQEISVEDRNKSILNVIKKTGSKIRKLSSIESPYAIKKVIQSIKTKEEALILSGLMLKNNYYSYFSPQNKGHLGLASSAYAQVTSPIRRFGDLFVEFMYDNIEKIMASEESLQKLDEDLENLCEQINKMNKLALKAEQEVKQLFELNQLANNTDKDFYGLVQEIDDEHLIVNLGKYVIGIVNLKDLDECYTHNHNVKFIKSSSGKKIYVGSQLKLKIKEVDFMNNTVNFYGSLVHNLNGPILCKKKITD